MKKKKIRKTKRKRGKAVLRKIIFKREEENPIISPRIENDWEAWQTFNPGVILLENKIHFLYRAIGQDGISRLGYGSSEDGVHLKERLSYPVYEHRLKKHSFNIFSYFSGGSFGGCEDPRIVRVDNEEILYITYTACENGLRVGLTSIRVKDFLAKKWYWQKVRLISPPNEVHKNWTIFPEKIKGRYAILHSLSPEILIDYFESLEFSENTYIKSYYQRIRRRNCWDSWIKGVGPPPLKTKDGWLLFYHAIDEKEPFQYKVGAMLLDYENPKKIILRAKSPILEPIYPYEKEGFKGGVVYVSGAVIKEGELLLYYGAADSHVCVASANLEDFLEALKKEKKPKMKKRKIKKKKN